MNINRLNILGQEPSIMADHLAELRDAMIQKDSMRFRRNLERIAEIFAYEISKTLTYIKKPVETQLGVKECLVLKNQPVIASIMRAGIPMHNGMLNVFDKAENAFISAYRKHISDKEFEICLEYTSSPDLNGKILFINDPMGATGQSLVSTYKQLTDGEHKRGQPAHTHIISAIASQQGIDYLQEQLPAKDVTLWIGDVDDELNAKSYIVPGLGDAGDLAFGQKL